MIMGQKRKTLLAATVIFLFLSIQLFESIAKRNDWPFSSFAMYSETLAYKDSVVVLVGHFRDGESQVLLPWDVFPVDYYKMRGMMNDLFLKDKLNVLKEKKEVIASLFSKRVVKKGLVKLEFLKIVASESNLKNLTDSISGAETLYVYDYEK